MSTLRVIGLWLGPDAPGWPNVLDFVNTDAGGREALAARLEAAPRTDRLYMGYSTCRICGCRNGNGEYTNGVYIWPEGLAHYVRAHSVVLPFGVEEALLTVVPGSQDLEWAMSADSDCRDYEWWRSLTLQE